MGQVKEIEPRGPAKVLIRPYKADDHEVVKSIFVKGTMEGPGSPLTQALGAFRPHLIAASCMLVLGIASTLTYLDQPLSQVIKRPHILIQTGSPLDIWWIIGLYQASVGLYVYAFLRRRALKSFLLYFLGGGLQDLKDIPYTYDLDAPSEPTNPYFSANGPGGFWVAEKDGKIAGFVGLKTSKQPPARDPKVWVVSRLIVAGDMRGHGIGQLLMDAVYAHARKHDVRRLELVTSTFFNKGANRMYRRDGWTRVSTWRDRGELLQTLEKML